MYGGRRFFSWASKLRRDELTADRHDPATPDDDTDTRKPIREILSWSLGAALIGFVYGAACSVVWSAYEHLGRHGVAATPPLITAETHTFKTVPGDRTERVLAESEDVRPPVGALLLRRAGRLAERNDALPSIQPASIKLAAAHQLAAKAPPTDLQEPPVPTMAETSPDTSPDLPVTAPEAPALETMTVGRGGPPPAPTPSFKPARPVIAHATLRPPRPAFKPGDVTPAAAPTARIASVSSPIDYFRNWLGRIVAAVEAVEVRNDSTFFVASSDRRDRSAGGSTLARSERGGGGGGSVGASSGRGRDNSDRGRGNGNGGGRNDDD